jgi:hypothetical protein
MSATFNDLLLDRGIAPKDVALLRHHTPASGGQDIERAQIYAKRLCAHLWVDSMRRRLQHSKGIHRTVVASPLG